MEYTNKLIKYSSSQIILLGTLWALAGYLPKNLNMHIKFLGNKIIFSLNDYYYYFTIGLTFISIKNIIYF